LLVCKPLAALFGRSAAGIEKTAYSPFLLVANPGEIMQKRRIGRSELEVAPLMFGGNVFGWTADEATSFSILDAFVDAGLNFIDTADVYSAWVPGNQGGESETIIGKWFRQSGKRDTH
jgi:aryl-alcohol dehydrogenase-like predicted oxidoreductase